MNAACLHCAFGPGGPGEKEVQGIALEDCGVTFMLDLCAGRAGQLDVVCVCFLERFGELREAMCCLDRYRVVVK